MEIILIAVPFFFILIGIELWLDKKRNAGFYQFNDAINSLNLGVMSRLTGILKAALPISAYFWIYDKFAMWSLPETSLLVWLFAFVIYDLGYYWVHRLSHEMAIMWGSHVVHHSSEEYNLTTALRQTGTPAIFAWIIFLPMAFIGISTEVMLAVGSLNLIYQFWVHTRHIDKMPNWYEAIFVTPSNHRVHHGLNKEYIDKNYGGVFIFWDRIFGTFAAERDDIEIVYGVSDQLNSWNPIWANTKVYKNLAMDAWHTQKIGDKFKTLLKPPGWRAADVEHKFPRSYATSSDLVKYDVQLDTGTRGYLLAQFTQLIAMVFALLLLVEALPLPISIAIGLFAIFHCWVISGLQENKTWIRWLEPLRLASTSVLLFVMIQILSGITWLAVVLSTGVLLNLLWFMKKRKNTILSNSGPMQNV